MKRPALQVEDLVVVYEGRKSWLGLKRAEPVHAVNGVSFTLQSGEILGLVGESGCGKTTLGKAVIRLIPAQKGRVLLGEEDFMALKGEALRRARPRIQMIFQDPYASLDPRMTIAETLAEPLWVHKKLTSTECDRRIRQVLDQVGLSARSRGRYPHEFSGGQRQRIAIARALILEPHVIIADEPVSSLDVSVQAQILNLLKDIRRGLGLSMLFISHNLAVVKYLCDRIAVMNSGGIVEMGPSQQICRAPQHPYTQGLISAVPIPDPRFRAKAVLG